MGKSVLVHSCCGPCLIYPFERLSEMGLRVTAFWYNPNIFPKNELLNRKESLLKYCSRHKIGVIAYENENREEFYSWIFPSGHEAKTSRCKICWDMRLRVTAKYALENKYNAFTTTLLVSTYQDIDMIRKLGKKIASSYGIKFIDIDFREGFGYAHCKAEKEGLYRQRWCGCIYSFNDRFNAMVCRRSKKVDNLRL